MKTMLMGFSIASQIAGVGLGTSLSMCVIVVLGVIFPALINGLPGGPPAALVSVGVILGVAGFLLMGYACILREKGRAEASTNARNINDVEMEEDLANATCAPQTCEPEVSTLHFPQQQLQGVVPPSMMMHSVAGAHFGNDSDNENAAKSTEVKGGAAANNLGVAEGWSPLSAVVLCLVAGLLSACLQLAFVLGVSPYPQILNLKPQARNNKP
jgi:Flp pilus assembly protein TadB